MAKCKLCLIGEITGIKSHIFTDSLIRSAIYIEGKPNVGIKKQWLILVLKT